MKALLYDINNALVGTTSALPDTRAWPHYLIARGQTRVGDLVLYRLRPGTAGEYDEISGVPVVAVDGAAPGVGSDVCLAALRRVIDRHKSAAGGVNFELIALREAEEEILAAINQ